MNNGKYLGAIYGEGKLEQFVKCDYFIHTSRYEGMPMAVLEALSFGIPCIVTDKTNMEEIINEANGGFVTNSSINDVRNTIIRAINDRSTIHVNVQWMENHLLWSKIAKKYEKLYTIYSI